MDQQLNDLLDRARSGDREPFDDLLRALRARPLDPAALLGYLRAPDPILRRAGVVLAGDHPDPELLPVLAELARDPDREVRLALARGILLGSWDALDAAVAELLRDHDDEVRRAAATAAAGRPTLEVHLVERLGQDVDWRVRQEIARALGDGTPRAVLPVLVRALAEDADGDVQYELAGAAERLLQRLGGYPADLARPAFRLLQEAHSRVSRFQEGYCPRLAGWLGERVRVDIDLDSLAGFGTILTLEAAQGRLPRAYRLDDSLDTVVRMLKGEPPRAVVLTGEPGVGKTALVQELVHRLRDDPDGPWTVLTLSPADFLADTLYLGEWETKLRKLVQAIRPPRRVLLYVPTLEDLATMGTSAKSDANVATALAPSIERGEVTILGESTIEAFRKGLGAVHSLRRLFHAVELKPAEPAETRLILQAVVRESGADISEAVLDRLLELADFYSAGVAQPGQAVGLLRRVLSGLADQSGPVGERDVLATISTSTGVPVDILDDGVPLDRAAVRAFFEARVMGQPEAVEAVVDLVTLIKAGLTDPGKPFGVLLFVGPTGVGKTELARSLAELLFGDPARMTRLDMSEYATYEAYERLIGRGTTPGLLTATVRERPFSVLLLDEIEKAHLNVYDLCLQIFDAGRLTDGQGRTADFRRSIIILTSNVGSRVAQEAPVGFGRAVPPPDPSATLRELGRVFRPEFLNRLDRIVTFRPLSAETAEKIARRELDRVMERSGIARRRLTVDVDPAVMPLLLREGYTPAYGARPLKRTVERLVLLPLARAIAAGEAAAGSLLRLVARRGRVEVEVVAPEPPDAEPPSSTRRLEPPRAVPLRERAARLAERVAGARDKAGPLVQRKSELLARAAAPGFWDNRREARALYDEIYRIDGVLAALDDLERAVRDEVEAVERSRGDDRHLDRLGERLEALDGQAAHVAFLVGCREARDLGDAFVALTRLAGHGARLDGVAMLARMYANLARRHRLDVDVLDDRQSTDPAEDVIVLSVSGAGAFALFAGEAGLHQLARGRTKAKIREGKKAPDREVVRVEVLPVPLEEESGREAIRAEVRSLPESAGRLMARRRLEVQLRHESSLLTLRAWSDRSRAEAVELLRPLLRARVAAAETAGPPEGRPATVRRYSLGPAPLVRDVRSGRSTGRLEEVLDGQLEQFLTPPAQATE